MKRLSWRMFAYIFLFLVATFVQPLTSSALSTDTGTSGLVIGSYNTLHCYDRGGKNIQTRIKTIAANIQTLGYDVVGVQEYNYPNCKGDLLKALNNSGGQWQETEQGSHYQTNQTSILWNADVVTITSQELVDIDRPSNTKPTYISGHDGPVSGGTRYAHVAHFTDKNGYAFVVANVHLATFSDSGNRKTVAAANHRKEEITNLIKHLEPETDPVFITGDMNASTGNSSYANKSAWKAFYDTVAQYGYSVSHNTATTKQNGLYASIGTSTKSANTIDQIFYRNINAPTYYETFGCVSKPSGLGTCGSDHHPVKAVFNDLSGSGSTYCNGVSSLDASRQDQFAAWDITFYDPTIQACCNTAVTSGSLVGDTNAERAYNFLVTTSIKTNGGEPMSAAQAAGAVGSFMRESAGDTYDLKPSASNGTHFGIVQWGGTRYTALKNFAESKGTKWTDLKTQLEFVVYELEHSESAIIKDSDFKAVSDTDSGARKAAERWDTLYERSGGAGLSLRQTNASKIFKDFGNTNATSNGDSDATDGSESDDEETDNSSTDTTTLSSTTDTTSAGCVDTSGYVFPLQATQSDIRSWGNNPGTTEWTSGRYHENVIDGYYAVDIYAPEGTPVVAFQTGEVINTNIDSHGALSVQIKDSEGYTVYYQHMSQSRGAKVKVGDTVNAGTVIAYVGNSAEAWGTTPHLHIDKSKNPGKGYRGSCSAYLNSCPVASEHRFVRINTELHDSYEKLSETGTSSL